MIERNHQIRSSKNVLGQPSFQQWEHRHSCHGGQRVNDLGHSHPTIKNTREVNFFSPTEMNRFITSSLKCEKETRDVGGRWRLKSALTPILETNTPRGDICVCRSPGGRQDGPPDLSYLSGCKQLPVKRGHLRNFERRERSKD